MPATVSKATNFETSDYITKTVNGDDTETKHCLDFILTRQYHYWMSILYNTDLPVDMPYSTFKRLICRKTCALTGRVLPESHSQRVLWVIDKTAPVDKDNVLTTTTELSGVMDTNDDRS